MITFLNMLRTINFAFLQRMPFRYFISLSYNGMAYCGWQRQPNADTVQQRIEDAISTVFGIHEGVTGCGRTDTGVHASEYFAHFDTEKEFSASELAQMTNRLNRFLPADIALHVIRPVKAGVHARFSALQRVYRYQVMRQKDPFETSNSFFLYGNLDIVLMNQCAHSLIGRHDFECFSKVHTQVSNFFCSVSEAEWTEDGHILTFTISADRFLRNMVRAIVGTLLEVGRGKMTPIEFAAVIAGRNRSNAGTSVPAKGLTLVSVKYPDGIYSDVPVWFSYESLHKEKCHGEADSQFHESAGQETDE